MPRRAEPAAAIACACDRGHGFPLRESASRDLGVLRVLGEAFGFVVEAVDKVRTTIHDESEINASSTIIRELIKTGACDAERVLGRHHRVEGSSSGRSARTHDRLPHRQRRPRDTPARRRRLRRTATLPTGQTLRPRSAWARDRPSPARPNAGSRSTFWESRRRRSDRRPARVRLASGGRPPRGSASKSGTLHSTRRSNEPNATRPHVEIIGRSPETTTAR